MLSKDEFFMFKALKLAKIAKIQGEIPVGAIIVKNNKIIATGYNKKEQKQNSLCHAEIECINKASRELSNWRLTGCHIYVTLEPCTMCMGAIISSRISKIFFGANDFINRDFNLNLVNSKYNFRPSIKGGILEKKCTNILKDFFKNLRKIKILNNAK